MGFLDKVKGLLKGNETEPTQTDEAEVTATGRVLDDHPSAKISSDDVVIYDEPNVVLMDLIE
ncbi:hypothetical protein HAINFHK1212_1405 [Haemophilus influenzae HK1212]|uniref:Uncharacterized protein n=1 Tax=Haemophilus influenzae HK1212 TaxID=456482 RepID=A0A7G2JWU5_HAEIF|nr:hypothetical protein HAINFHK1212_1405 [Haemophilus influenzae HK1212]